MITVETLLNSLSKGNNSNLLHAYPKSDCLISKMKIICGQNSPLKTSLLPRKIAKFDKSRTPPEKILSGKVLPPKNKTPKIPFPKKIIKTIRLKYYLP